MVVRVKGVVELKKYFNRLGKWVQMEIPKLTEEQARQGKKYAVGIAPRQTGALINAIGVRKGNNKEYTLVSRTPQGNNHRKIPYHVYLHEGKRGGYEGTRKTGDHQYMETTYDYLKKRYPSRVEDGLDRQINK